MSVTSTNAPKRSRLSAALFAAILVPAAGVAFAQEQQSSTTSSPSTQATNTLDKVTVTGSRIKRAEIEGPAPVTIVTAEDIEKRRFPRTGRPEQHHEFFLGRKGRLQREFSAA